MFARVSSDVGGLVGNGRGAMIRSVSVSGVHISADSSNVGGLVGNGRGAMIHAASVSGVTVSAAGNKAGGLVGNGRDAMIRAAFVSATVVAGRFKVGGLVGSGDDDAEISYSYVVGGTVSDTDPSSFGSAGTGSLVGFGEDSMIRFSYTAGGPVSGMRDDKVGGLIGDIGTQGETMVDDSYWNTDTTGQSASAGENLGMGLTTAQLQGQTDFTGANNIYAAWGNLWCDPDTGDVMESTAALASPFVRVWDLGTSSQYPALNCLPVSVEQQRQ